MFNGDKALDILLPSFKPFKTNRDEEPIFILNVKNNLEETEDSHCKLIRDVDTGNGITSVSKLNNGGYQFNVRDVSDKQCALIICDAEFKQCDCGISGSFPQMRFALNNALMLIFAFSSAIHDTLLVHASVIRHNDMAYAFTAKSGTGKSTQVANWMRTIEGCDIINDDNPVLRVEDGKVMLYGSPWSGKTPCYRNVVAPLGALMLIKRDESNFVKELSPIIGFSTLLTACSAMKWDETLFQYVCDTVSKIVEKVRVAELHCLADAESALCCKEYLKGEK